MVEYENAVATRTRLRKWCYLFIELVNACTDISFKLAGKAFSSVDEKRRLGPGELSELGYQLNCMNIKFGEYVNNIKCN
jgi:hypothetical protein